MRATTVFKRVLRLPSTRVVGARIEGDTVVVSVKTQRHRRMCPCGTLTWSVYDRRVRRWRHLDACGTRIVLEAEICRVDCRSCGRVRTEEVPWARPAARHTIPFENLVLWCARRMDKSAVADMLAVAWETVDAMVTRAAGSPETLARLDGLRRIGVDEISHRRGHRYLSVVVDHDTGDVVWAAEGKGADTLGEFYKLLGPRRCKLLKAVSMDLGAPYRKATRTAARNAQICADPFHLIKLINETIDTVRRRTLRDVKDPQLRWALLKRPENLSRHQRQLLDQLVADETDAWRAWSFREEFRRILKLPAPQAPAAVDRWLADTQASTLAPIRNLGRRFQQHRNLIINAIALSLSNGRLEGTNSKIRLLNHRGYGHHRPSALIALIMLACSTETAI